ncbi:pentatricopeptide repeat-containing protein At1g51965, mitochondrial [Capsella rubella]|nr:pentatricopeptide repeat-containing protein At1g51965, mitochondrial [Capsella rubella]
MKLLRRRFFNPVDTITRANRRQYATKYVAKVTSSSPSGRSLSAEVSLPNPLPADVRGYPLPRRHLICRATNLITGATNISDAFSDLSDYLSSLSLSLTPDEASEILKSLNSPKLAVEFFKFVPSLCPNSHNDPFLHNRIILILSRSNLPDRFDRVRSILDSMVKSNVSGNISTVNILIGFFGDTEDLQMCLRLVKKWELKMNSFTYKCLLQAYLRSRDSSKAFDVYCEIRRGGHKLDIFAYNMLLDALAKDEKIDQACKVFEDMKKMHCRRDEYSYTIMIRTMGRIGKYNEAVGLFNEMITEGLMLNVVGYNTLMQVLAKGKMVDKAIQVFSRMVETGCRPNEYTYSLVLNLLVAEGQLVKLDGIVEMSKRYMTQGIYSYLVRTLSKLGHVSEAHRLFCDMWSFPVKGERDSYMSMLESLCGAGKTIEAIEMLSKIHEKGVVTDTMMYNTVFSALGKLKQISHIHDLFEKMKKDGPCPDIFTYNILISSFGRVGEVDHAINIFEELEKSDCKPDIVSYNSLINCLGKNGDVDEAHVRFKEMQERGLDPDVVTYSTLMECFGKTERVEMAYRLFEEMLVKGCQPNIVTYNIMLDCLERSGRTAEAVDLYTKMKQQGLTPDSITYTVLERLQSGSHGKSRIRRKNPITGWVVSPL